MIDIRTTSAVIILLAVTLIALAGPTNAIAVDGRSNDSRNPTGGVRYFYLPSVADYGSGASIRTDWYTPGGLGGGIGVFVGHPNGLARGDRALMRFNLSALFLRPQASISNQHAVLRFSVSSLAGKAEERNIEIVYLTYDPWTFTGNDLVNTKAEVVATVAVKRKDVPGHVYSINVTKWVQKGLLQGNKFCGFRFRDVGAETQGNPDIAAVGVSIGVHGSVPALEVRETK